MNSLYFKEINTPAKAYLLGFIIADGNVTLPKGNRQARFSCYQHKKQKEVIELLQSEIKPNANLHYVKSRKQYAFYLSSDDFCYYLSLYGVVPNKSHIEIPFPELDYMSDFIRGFYEGDGTAGKYGSNRRLSFVSNSKLFLEGLQAYLKSKNIKTRLYSEKSFWRLRSSDLVSIRNFYDLCYPSKYSCRYKEEQLLKAREYRGNLKRLSGTVEHRN